MFLSFVFSFKCFVLFFFPFKNKNISPLEQETVWLKQQFYEDAEILYHMQMASLPSAEVYF